MADLNFTPRVIKLLIPIPGGPITSRTLIRIAAPTSRDAIPSLVLAAVGLGFDVINSQGLVVDRSAVAVRATITPSVFDCTTPHAPGFSGVHGF